MSVSLAERVIFAIYFGFLVVFGLIANTGILIVLYRNKDYRKRASTYYLYSILISSILACVTEMPYYLLSVTARLPPPKGNAYEAQCKVAVFFTYSISAIKIYVLAGMSLDRFIAVLYPYLYDAHMTKFKAKMLNSFLWLAAIVITLPLSVKDGLSIYKGKIGASCGVDWQVISKAYFMCSLLISFIFPAVILVITNVKVFMVARKQNSQINNESFKNKHATGKGQIEKPPNSETSVPNTLRTRAYAWTVNQYPSASFREAIPSSLHGPSHAVDRHHVTNSSERSTWNSKKGSGARFSPKGNLPNRLSIEVLDSNCVDAVETVAVANQTLSEGPADNFMLSKVSSPLVDFQRQHSTAETVTATTSRIAKLSKRSKLLPTREIEWSIIGSTLLLVAAFFITWSPFVISRAIESFTKVLEEKVRLYTTASTLLDIFINPLIIVGTRKTFRKKFHDLSLCKN